MVARSGFVRSAHAYMPAYSDGLVFFFVVTGVNALSAAFYSQNNVGLQAVNAGVISRTSASFRITLMHSLHRQAHPS